MSKKWGAVLRGHDFDLDDWRNALKPPFDPWVEVHGPETILCSATFDGMTSADEVRNSAVSAIERLNGAMAVYNRTRPIQFGGVAEILADGRVNRTILRRWRGLKRAGGQPLLQWYWDRMESRKKNRPARAKCRTGHSGLIRMII